MRANLGLCFVWLIGLRDAAITATMIQAFGPRAEMNPIAILILAIGGVPAMLVYKLALLVAFTLIVSRLGRVSANLARIVLTGGVTISIALMLYWDWALFGG